MRSLARIGRAAEFFVVAYRKDHFELEGLPFNFRVIGYERPDTSDLDNIAFPWLVRQIRPDVSHIPLNMVPLLMPAPYLVTVHDLSSLIFEKKTGWRHDLHFFRLQRGLLRAAQVLAVSSATARDVTSLLSIPSSKVKVIYGAPDPRFLTEAGKRDTVREAERQRILERYQVNYPFLLYSGNIRPQKNIPRLVEAFALIKGELDQHPVYHDLRLIIIGDEVSKSTAVRQAVLKAHVKPSVRFLGFVPIDTLRAFYESAEAFVFPSLYEGFGLPPLEAMACGIPVVAASTSSLPEVVGDAAVTVNPESVFDIARGIKEVLLDASLRSRLIAAGQRQVHRFNWDTTAAEVFATYLEVVSRKRPR
ncbi:MAG: glycosyltransferase family 4 protein [Bryobacterales bacterium]|nr:glycosyltransferase family 4 protein [Bryobacterales bacterium]